MGFQWRKRSRGKKGWWNASYSKKGAGLTGTVKVGKNVTYNTGDLSKNKKTSDRLTINFGNGLRYVKYGKRSTPTNNPTNLNPIAGFIQLVAGVGALLFVFLLFASAILSIFI